MFQYVILSVLIATVTCQYNPNSRTAAIISEQRYLSGDGKFGAAYTQEDGINFKEETDADGTRHGSYSYVDPSGQRRTVSYTAGRFGFQASGDHLPVPPPAPPQPVPTPGYQPNPRYQPPSGPAQGFSGDYDSEGQYDPRYNDPNFEGNKLPQSHAAPPPPPPPVNIHYQSTPAPNYNYQHNTPQYNHYQPPAPQQQQYQQHYETTPNPHRFLPPVTF
ncbi:pupal cuticle protein Edg-78E isoform X2 [Condylostylus longicornis]|uniref:pupal cuticle protein Edg-78E isoform X2 n=1 Tax=Condylostylus longicornis TaxID=2530218 RepID=UPI00244E1876|nr:pupal cuticle protein Edg-78E isoform X2 [Condylostylus longicornis]